jgi:hypothetical protein
MEDIFNQMVKKIIKEQELIIGPLAWDEARKVPGLKVVDQKQALVSFDNGDKKSVIDKLVAQYDRLFGRASHEVCRGAVISIISEVSPAEIPLSLRA